MALFNLLSLFPIGGAPPSWTGYSMILLLPVSAWVYSRTLGDSEDERQAVSHTAAFVWNLPQDRHASPHVNG